jgi:hypothetical protein
MSINVLFLAALAIAAVSAQDPVPATLGANGEAIREHMCKRGPGICWVRPALRIPWSPGPLVPCLTRRPPARCLLAAHFLDSPYYETQFRVYDSFFDSSKWITNNMVTSTANDCYNQCDSEPNCKVGRRAPRVCAGLLPLPCAHGCRVCCLQAFVRYRVAKATGSWRCRTLTEVGYEVYNNTFRSASYRMKDRSCPVEWERLRPGFLAEVYVIYGEETTILTQDLERCDVDNIVEIFIDQPGVMPGLPAKMFNSTVNWTLDYFTMYNQTFTVADMHEDALWYMTSLYWMDIMRGELDSLPDGFFKNNSNLFRVSFRYQPNFHVFPPSIISPEANPAFRTFDVYFDTYLNCTHPDIVDFYNLLEWNMTNIYADPPVYVMVMDQQYCFYNGRWQGEDWWPTPAP